MKTVNKTNIISITLIAALFELATLTTCFGMGVDPREHKRATPARHANSERQTSINDLPDDVLGYISKIAIDQSTDELKSTTRANITCTSKKFRRAMRLPVLGLYSHLKITNNSFESNDYIMDEFFVPEKIAQLMMYVKTHGDLIRYVDASFSKIDDITLAYICSHAINLVSLNLSCCTKLEQIDLTEFTNLEELHLYNVKINDEQLTQICNKNKNIRILDLGGASPQLSEFNLDELHHLEMLDLRATKITDTQLDKIITNNPNIKILRIYNCGQLNSFNLCELHQLEELVLDYTNITDEQLSTICSNNPNIKILSLARTKKLREFNLEGLIHLEKLYLCEAKITDEQLTRICANNPHIKRLELAECNQLSQFDLGRLAQLEKLGLNNTNITDDQLTRLCANNPHIMSLDITGCRELSQFDLHSLTHLKKLYVWDVDSTDEQLDRVRGNNPDIQIYC